MSREQLRNDSLVLRDVKCTGSVTDYSLVSFQSATNGYTLFTGTYPNELPDGIANLQYTDTSKCVVYTGGIMPYVGATAGTKYYYNSGITTTVSPIFIGTGVEGVGISLVNFKTMEGVKKYIADNVVGGTQEVVSYANIASFPATGVVNTIYIASDTGYTYSWNGSAYVATYSSSGSSNEIVYTLPAGETISAGDMVKVGDYTTGGGVSLPSGTDIYVEFNGNDLDPISHAPTILDIFDAKTNVTYVSSGRGDGKQVASFNGIDSTITSNSMGSFDRTTGQTFSISAKINSSGGSGFRDIASLRGSGGHNWILYISNTGVLGFHGTSQNNTGYVVPVGTWVTVGATVATDGTMKVYVDGVLQQTFTGFTFGTPYTEHFSIGSADGGGEFYNGLISDLIITQGELTAGEMLQLHNTTSFVSSYNISQLIGGSFGIAEGLGSNSNIFVGQSIVTVGAGSLTSAKFYLCNNSSTLYSGNIVGQIRSVDGNTIIATSNETLAGSSVAYSATTYTPYIFTFPSSSLSASTQYIVGLSGSALNQGSDFILVQANVNQYNSGVLTTYPPLSGNGAYDLLFDFTISSGAQVVTVDGLFKASASNTDGFIGIAKGNGTTGTNVEFTVSGINANQSGLTRNAIYYLSNTAGAVSETPGTNSVVVGKALSSTRLVIDRNDVTESNITASFEAGEDILANDLVCLPSNYSIKQLISDADTYTGLLESKGQTFTLGGITKLNSIKWYTRNYLLSFPVVFDATVRVYSSQGGTLLGTYTNQLTIAAGASDVEYTTSLSSLDVSSYSTIYIQWDFGAVAQTPQSVAMYYNSSSVYSGGTRYSNGTATSGDLKFILDGEVSATNRKLYKTDADDANLLYPIGFAKVATTTGNNCNVVISGNVTGLSSLSKGAHYYPSVSAGLLSTTAVGTSIGFATSNTSIFIK